MERAAEDMGDVSQEPSNKHMDNERHGRADAGRSPGMSPDAKKWLEENRDAIVAFNAWDEEHGSPLDRYRGL